MTPSICITAAFFSAALATAKDTVSKKVSGDVSSNLSSFASFLFPLPFYLLFLAICLPMGWESITLSAVFLRYVFFRTLTDVVAETSKMRAFSTGELSVVSGIVALHPLVALIVAPYITGESGNGNLWFGVCVAVVGNIIILGPTTPSVNARKTVFWSVITAIFFALNNSIDRLSVQVATPIYSGFAMTLVACLALSPFAFPKTAREAIRVNSQAFWLRGAFEAAQMSSKLFALTLLPVPLVSAIIRCSILFSVLAGGFVLGEKATIRKLIGASVSILGLSWAILGG